VGAIVVEIGLHAAEDKVHVHDLHVTLLTLLGLEDTKLTYFVQGRDFRLTDVGGRNQPGPAPDGGVAASRNRKKV
jgi:hypothetical protein